MRAWAGTALRRARNCSGRPTMPLGMKTVTRMNSVPKISSHISG